MYLSSVVQFLYEFEFSDKNFPINHNFLDLHNTIMKNIEILGNTQIEIKPGKFYNLKRILHERFLASVTALSIYGTSFPNRHKLAVLIIINNYDFLACVLRVTNCPILNTISHEFKQMNIYR